MYLELGHLRPGRLMTAAVVAAAVAWTAALVLLGPSTAAQALSNFGLCGAAFLAGVGGLVRRTRHSQRADRRFWLLLGAAMLSWSAGQAVWTWYESVLGRDVPFPSPADWGYLGLPPLATIALLGLPLAAPTAAGRIRALLDGLMVAASLLVGSWILVLGPTFRAGADSATSQIISLAYPISDVVLLTIVICTWLRARHGHRALPVSLPLVGTGLVFFAVSDSGFTYLTTSGAYSSGNVIDVGWFAGFVILLLAALRRPAGGYDAHVDAATDDEVVSQPITYLLPYAAVLVGLLTSSVEVLRTGRTDTIVSWIRTLIMVLLVLRQILTLRENNVLTKTLEERVRSRTAELEVSRERFAAMVRHSSDVVTVVDPTGTVLYQSASSERVLGFAPEALMGSSLFDVTASSTDREHLAAALEHVALEEMRIHTLTSTWRHADGHDCRIEVTITNLLGDPHVNGLVLNSRDITDRVALEEQLTGLAFTDSLTTLANRALFKDRLQHALSRRRSTAGTVAVLFLDLDGFKSVNDMLGHSVGDALLVQVADRLRGVLRPADTVARFGGDEFAVLLDDTADEDYQTELAERISEAIRAPYDLQGERVHVSTSIGIARDDEHATTAEQLLRNADLAMYQAKAAGTGGYAVFEHHMHAGLVERVRLETDLRQAVDNGEFVVHYQPMVSLRSGDITGFEALVRWAHPTRGLLPPGDFIGVAESTGLIRPIGLTVLRVACAQTVEWQQSFGAARPLRISVNVSPRQLLERDFVDQVRAVLEETSLPPSRLTLEMTETALIDDRQDVLDVLQALHELGVRLAIDDFGTGYSSLSYLHKFPVDVLKIDRSFVERLGRDGEAALVSTILHLGQSLQLETVAEGIERPQEMLVLRRQGCTTGQGFHFSPPMSAEAVAEILDERSGPAAEAMSEPVA